jgi:hypothetical protein
LPTFGFKNAALLGIIAVFCYKSGIRTKLLLTEIASLEQVFESIKNFPKIKGFKSTFSLFLNKDTGKLLKKRGLTLN